MSLFEFPLPDIGEGVAEGEVVEWKVSEGDVVAEDDVLCEVMTDKATVEITSPLPGTVKAIKAAEGAVTPVGATLLTIEPAIEPMLKEKAARDAGFEGSDYIGSYLRRFLNEHHDTLCIAVK